MTQNLKQRIQNRKLKLKYTIVHQEDQTTEIKTEVQEKLEMKMYHTTILQEEDLAEARTIITNTEEVPAESPILEKKEVISHNMSEVLMEETEEGNQEEMTNGQIEEAPAD